MNHRARGAVRLRPFPAAGTRGGPRSLLRRRPEAWRPAARAKECGGAHGEGRELPVRRTHDEGPALRRVLELGSRGTRLAGPTGEGP
ncbi:hypothetical protein NDU88_008644 [Pleurodeles waltl]|uniref:Uncharacterized protein n=1 Tax=Pleurodeles waltl TaxID=8319 RepID=A0AAV7RUD8_PLEWA|nr:hypothetical protein NDU88_008644 [Pleurodeles waltl]